jgi:protein-L-isoaspartate(D-aspartate) O-methyltransferase
LYVGDGTLGLPKHAPFDKIIVTAAAPSPPDSLLRQLAIHGMLVLPIGNKNTQQMVRITRISEENYDEERFDDFRFVPLIGEKGW